MFAIPPEVPIWVTPLWMVGLGTMFGLVVLLGLWGICALLSLIPPFKTLTDSPAARRWLASILAIDLLALLLFVLFSYESLEGGRPMWFVATVSVLGTIALSGIVIGLSSRKTVTEVPMAVNEGVLLWVLVVALILSGIGLFGTVIVQEPWQMLASIPRIPVTGVQTTVHTIAAPQERVSDEIDLTVDEQSIPLSVPTRELKSLEFESTQRLEISLYSFKDLTAAVAGTTLEVSADQPYVWISGDQEFVPDETVTQLFVRNLGDEEATLRMGIHLAPEHPEMATVFVSAAIVIAIFLAYLLIRSLLPKIAAVSMSSIKSEIAQFHFVVLLVIGSAALIVFIYVPYHTFGEDIKMLKISGLEWIRVLAVFVAIWAASKSLAEEIEGRTALTVLSKPIGRREFIFGKYLGIAWSVVIVFTVLGVVLLGISAYKPVYDAYETATDDATWQHSHAEMIRVIPGLLLAFMGVLQLTALSVAFSTRMTTLANFLTCFVIYVLGHLTPSMVQSALGRFELVEFSARVFATVFPVLDYFDTQASVSGGTAVPLVYLGWSLVYCLIYGTIAMLLALVLFEDRDLA